MDSGTEQTFTEIRDRLEDIAAQVKGDDVSLDTALDFYDEAVKLGMQATELLESMNDVSEASDDAESSEVEETV